MQKTWGLSEVNLLMAGWKMNFLKPVFMCCLHGLQTRKISRELMLSTSWVHINASICCLSSSVDLCCWSLCAPQYYLTWCCNNSSHWESITDAFCHCNHIGNNFMTLKTPEVASCSAKSGLHLWGANRPSLFTIDKGALQRWKYANSVSLSLN